MGFLKVLSLPILNICLHLLSHISSFGKATEVFLCCFLTVQQHNCNVASQMISSSLVLLLKSSNFLSLTGIPTQAKYYHWAESSSLLCLKEMSASWVTLVVFLSSVLRVFNPTARPACLSGFNTQVFYLIDSAVYFPLQTCVTLLELMSQFMRKVYY